MILFVVVWLIPIVGLWHGSRNQRQYPSVEDDNAKIAYGIVLWNPPQPLYVTLREIYGHGAHFGTAVSIFICKKTRQKAIYDK